MESVYNKNAMPKIALSFNESKEHNFCGVQMKPDYPNVGMAVFHDGQMTNISISGPYPKITHTPKSSPNASD